MVHKFTRKQNIFRSFYKIIEQGKKLDFWSLVRRDISFQIIIKHNYDLWVFKRPFPFNSCWYFLLLLIYGSVRNLLLESLGLIIAEMQE